MMLGLVDVKDWIKTIFEADHYYMGKLDNKKDKSIGIYQRKNPMPPRVCLGGINLASYEVKQVSILIHWNNDANDTEKASYELFEALLGCQRVTINNIDVPFINLVTNEPVDVGTDDKGIYERVIEMDIYYKK